MAPGTEIHSWTAIQNYQGSRTQPVLPLLKKGQTYRLDAFYTTVPQDSVYLKVSFWDRYDKEVKQIIEKSHSVTFVYPKEAYYYSIALLSAGVLELNFKGMGIEEVGDGHV